MLRKALAQVKHYKRESKRNSSAAVAKKTMTMKMVMIMMTIMTTCIIVFVNN